MPNVSGIRPYVAALLLGALASAGGAQTHKMLHSFANDPGGLPIASLLEASDGKLYGTTLSGGSWGLGTVYALTPDGVGGWTYSLLAEFSGTGNDPYSIAGPLIEASDGGFYGTSQGGGDFQLGTVFRIDAAGQFEIVHSFSSSEGHQPAAGLVEGPGGVLYGTTFQGGGHSYGTVFRMDLSGDGFAVLHDFTDQEGFPERRGLLLGSDGLLYGTAYAPTLKGIVFSVSTSGEWALLHAFDGSDGESPEGGLVEAANGLFYGTTFGGGDLGWGTFYSIAADGSFQLIASFASGIVYPGGLVQASDGNFYGASSLGGAQSQGTVFRLTAGGVLEIVHDFVGTDGSAPAAAVIEATDGFLYGTTQRGGASDFGVVYRVQLTGEFENLHSFVTDGGTYPECAPVESPDGTFYGTTSRGGSRGRGTAFSFDASGQATYLHNFTPEEGSFLAEGLFDGHDGFFYGVAQSEAAEGHGSFFRMDPAGSVTVLHAFTDAEGGAPFIVPGQDGFFYGTNQAGVVRLDTSGGLTLLHAISPVPWYAYNRVMQASDGRLYGTDASGGAYGVGTIYRLESDGTAPTVLHEFTAFEGAYPFGRLLEASDGKLYGSTNSGGLHGVGVLFRIDTSGQYELLHSFENGTSGDGAYGATLIEGSDGYLYGATASYGSFGYGTVFRLDKNGEETVVHSFAGTDGSAPVAALVEGADGLLYGSTEFGGTFGGGTLFRVDPSSTLPVLAVSPSSGSSGGGDAIVVTGQGFLPGASVRIGTAAAAPALTFGVTEIHVTTPSLQAGSLNHVFVMNPDGTEGSLSRAFFSDFNDVPQSDPAHDYVEKIFRASVTAGCGGGSYCRFADVTRAQMAVFLLRALLGSRYYPPPATGTVFTDVPADSFAAPWIEDLAARGITAGCGVGIYCPTQSIRRSQMAVFLLKTLLGANYQPPAATGTVFADVPADSFAADWIEDLATRQISGGCLIDPVRFCPDSPTNRAQMAIFLVKTFGIP